MHKTGRKCTRIARDDAERRSQLTVTQCTRCLFPPTSPATRTRDPSRRPGFAGDPRRISTRYGCLTGDRVHDPTPKPLCVCRCGGTIRLRRGGERDGAPPGSRSDRMLRTPRSGGHGRRRERRHQEERGRRNRQSCNVAAGVPSTPHQAEWTGRDCLAGRSVAACVPNPPHAGMMTHVGERSNLDHRQRSQAGAAGARPGGDGATRRRWTATPAGRRTTLTPGEGCP